MKKINKRLWGSLILLAVLLMVVMIVFGPDQKPDLTKVDPRLSSIKYPLKELDIYFYLDGMKSCGFRIVDDSGKETLIAVMRPDKDRKVFMGTLVRPDESEELVEQEENILFLQQLLREYHEVNKRTDLALSYISGRWKYKFNVIMRKLNRGERSLE